MGAQAAPFLPLCLFGRCCYLFTSTKMIFPSALIHLFVTELGLSIGVMMVSCWSITQKFVIADLYTRASVVATGSMSPAQKTFWDAMQSQQETNPYDGGGRAFLEGRGSGMLTQGLDAKTLMPTTQLTLAEVARCVAHDEA